MERWNERIGEGAHHHSSSRLAERLVSFVPLYSTGAVCTIGQEKYGSACAPRDGVVRRLEECLHVHGNNSKNGF